VCPRLAVAPGAIRPRDLEHARAGPLDEWQLQRVPGRAGEFLRTVAKGAAPADRVPDRRDPSNVVPAARPPPRADAHPREPERPSEARRRSSHATGSSRGTGDRGVFRRPTWRPN
jgi:hypothetical protein